MADTHEHIPATRQYKALHDFVSGSATLSNAQDEFCSPVEDKFRSTKDAEAVEGVLWTSWGAVIEAAKAYAQDTSKRQKLVDFVLALKKRPTLEADGEECKVWDATVWSDLPVFGAELREGWNPPSESATEHDKHAWLNLNAFTAALVASAHENGGSPDLTLYAIWALRDALEQESPSSTAVETGAAWLICASPALSQLSEAGKVFDGKLARSGPAFGDKEWKGFSSDRWSTWTSQLNALDHKAHGPLAEELLTKAKSKVQAIGK